jgi:hypothetical protein
LNAIAPPSNPTRTAIFAIAAFAICSLAAAIRSNGFLEADGAMHYVIARHAIDEPVYLINMWGRPLCTGVYAIPAKFWGLIGVRATSLTIAIGIALIAWKLAIGQGLRWPVLALIFTLGEPLLFLHSFAELTELPFALVIGGALLAYQSRKFGIMTILCALAPLGRPEGFGFLILAAAGLIAHRKWGWLALLPSGLIAWSFFGNILSGPADSPWWKWLIIHWPYESGSEYARGSIFHYVMELPMIVGPFAFPAMWIGLARTPWIPKSDTLSRSRWLTAVLPIGVLIGHSLLYRFGKLSTSGEIRYLLIAAPMWGVLAAAGWEWVFTRLNWARPISWAALAVVVPGLVNYYWRVLPLQQAPSWICAQQFVAWYRGDLAVHRDYPHILTNHPGIFFYLDVSPSNPKYVQAWSRDAAAHPEPGMILVWDRIFCEFNADSNYVAPLQAVYAAGWVEDNEAERASAADRPELGDDPWHIFRSPLDIHSQQAPAVTENKLTASGRDQHI